MTRLATGEVFITRGIATAVAVAVVVSAAGCDPVAVGELSLGADEIGYEAPDERLASVRTVEEALDSLILGTLEDDLVGRWTGTLQSIDYPTGQWTVTEGLEATFSDDGTYSMNLAEISAGTGTDLYRWSGLWRTVGDGLLVLVAGNGPDYFSRIPFAVARDGHLISLLPVQDITDIIVLEERTR
jgi:hypothetical protein